MKTTYFKATALVTSLLIVGLLSGCGSNSGSLNTVPVKGRIVLAKNELLKPLADRQSAVQFESIEQPGIQAFGDILPDGTFSLSTVKDGEIADGLVAGSHRVRLIIDEQLSLYIPPKFERFETSGVQVKVAGEGEVIINLAK